MRRENNSGKKSRKSRERYDNGIRISASQTLMNLLPDHLRRDRRNRTISSKSSQDREERKSRSIKVVLGFLSFSSGW